ncbi:hypothetical protein FOA52_010797 [Chlamydomonas sp. UWO 241]|nr:hypothetical protein FOA52_010797 [Chlamydomonas sp. UWO 241]
MYLILAALLLAPVVVMGALVALIVTKIKNGEATLSGIPEIESTSKHWLYGHWRGFVDPKVHQYLAAQARLLGPIFRLRVVDTVICVLTDPVDISKMCCRGQDFQDKEASAYDPFNLIHWGPTTTNIVSMKTDDQWKLLRKGLSPCFSSTNMKLAMPVIQAISANILDQIEAAGPTQAFDMLDAARRMTAEVIARWGFKMTFGGEDLLKPNELVKLINQMFTAIHCLWMNPLYVFSLLTSKEARTHRTNTRAYDDYMAGVTRELQARPLDELPSDCIAGALMRVTQPSGEPLSFPQLKSNVAIMLAAGFETSASAINSAVLSLIQHPAELARLEEELDAFGLLKTPTRPEPRAVEWDDLGRMTYLNAVIKETLRLYPPASLGGMRATSKPTTLCGYDVPAGTWVLIPGCALDRSIAVYGEDADEFRPDRWLSRSSDSGGKDGAGISWASTGAYDDEDAGGVADQASAALVQGPSAGRLKEPIAFSMGPRDCVGQALARLDAQVFLAMLFSRFRVSLAPGMDSPEEIWSKTAYHVTLAMPDGLWLCMASR